VTRYPDQVESRGAIEFLYADGRVVTGSYENYAGRHLAKGDGLEFDDTDWVMYDRVDRAGVTVYLCRPAGLTLVDGGAEPPSGITELRATVTRLRDRYQLPSHEPDSRHLHVVRDDNKAGPDDPVVRRD
jgi:hypothetical protein